MPFTPTKEQLEGLAVGWNLIHQHWSNTDQDYNQQYQHDYPPLTVDEIVSNEELYKYVSDEEWFHLATEYSYDELVLGDYWELIDNYRTTRPTK